MGVVDILKNRWPGGYRSKYGISWAKIQGAILGAFSLHSKQSFINIAGSIPVIPANPFSNTGMLVVSKNKKMHKTRNLWCSRCLNPLKNMGCMVPQELCGWCTFHQAGFRIYSGERLLVVREPTLVTVKSKQRVAIQARSKMPINYKEILFYRKTTALARYPAPAMGMGG